MKFKIIVPIFALVFIAACSKSKKETPSYHNGNLTIVTDESFRSVTQALADGYMINYPDTKLTVKTKKEDFAFVDLLNNKDTIIVMSRDLSQKEVQEYKRMIGMDFTPAKFAADAVIFVVPKNSGKTMLSMTEIENGLLDDAKPFIFDGTNASNLNFVAQSIHKKPSDLRFKVIAGNENIIEQLEKYPDRIGVISLNTISRPYGAEAKKLREMVKILPVQKNGKILDPSLENLHDMSYPFTRVLYFITNEGGFNIASGFIRFSCTHLGQMIVQKEGLQRYNLYKREVQMH